MHGKGDKVMPETGENSGIIIASANLYPTWYEFKKNIEQQLGHSLLNWRWLMAKPEAPLPWNDCHMKATLSVVARLEKRKTVQKLTKNRRLSTGGGKFLRVDGLLSPDIRITSK